MAPSSSLVNQAIAIYTALVLACSALGYYAFQLSDPSRCRSLLQDGFWLNPTQLMNWQPSGCMLHTYKPREVGRCLADRRVVFVGAESTLATFNALLSKVEPEAFTPSLSKTNQLASIADINFEFVWDPEVTSNALGEIAKGFDSSAARPALTVIGLENNLTGTVSTTTTTAGGLAGGAKLGAIFSLFGGPRAQRARQSDATVFLPLMGGVGMMGQSSGASASAALDHQDNINELIVELGQQYNVDVASVFGKVVRETGATTVPLQQRSVKTSAVLADILLNRRCNDGLPKRYPYASTCCNAYPAPNWVQLSGAFFVAVAVPIAAYLYRQGYTPQSSTLLGLLPDSRHHWSIFTMGGVVLLCYLCDRTNIFGKEQKQTSPSQFFVLMGLTIVGSLFTLKSETKDQAFLNRDQTDEWKGWMQVAILIYHYVGVSKTEYIYNYMRVMPTAYLFMTGFGHTCYFLKKADFSFKRYVATMLRLNLLNVVLAYAMGNDWLLYYFAPLVTWNFHVAFLLLWIGHKHNGNRTFLFSKMLVAAMLNTAFYRIPGVLEAAWWVLQTAFRMQGDLREWRFRITLDQYSMFPGMIAAVAFLDWGSYQLPKSRHWPRAVQLATLVSLGIMGWYAVFETSQPSKPAYNSKHTYVSWLPCCAFVVLRNSTSWLRRTHNGFFAWVGRGSLETFLLQFHLWLAADTAGLLMFGPPNYRFLNAVIATPIFFYLAQLVTTATGGVIEWIMATEPRQPRQLPTTAPAKPPQSAQDELREKVGGSSDKTVVINVRELEKSSETQAAEQASSAPGWLDGLAAASKDLRVRMGVIVGAMAVLNWTYYL